MSTEMDKGRTEGKLFKAYFDNLFNNSLEVIAIVDRGFKVLNIIKDKISYR